MRKVSLSVMIILSLAIIAAAQNNRFEGFGGFSVSSFDTGLRNSGIANSNRETALGFETSATGYFNDHLGIEGDFDGHFKRATFIFSVTPTSPAISVDASLSSFNFMGGPHYRFSSSGKVTPFLRALVGGNYSKAGNVTLTSGGTPVPAAGGSETDLAMKFGGGVDIGWTKRAAVRVSADYNPIFQKSNGELNPNFGSRRTRNDFVFSVGIVFK